MEQAPPANLIRDLWLLPLSMRILLIASLCLAAFAQTPPEPLQEPWNGVPEGFRNLPVGRLNIPSSLARWKAQRAKVRSIVLNSLGDLPARPSPAKVSIVSVDRKPGWRIEKFVFDNGVDSRVPGYIAIPEDGKQRHPAILTMHGHGSSKDNMFGYQPTSQDVAELLVKNGYVVLGIDNYFNGERRGAGPAGSLETMQRGADQEMSLFKLNLWLGRTLWGMMLRDEQIALDYLASRPEVDPQRIGAQGMSMGSTRAWWLGAIDDRIKAVVGVACFTRYEDLIAIRQLRAHGIYYFVPGILKHFDSEGVMALLAPRPFLALTGDRDAGSPPAGMVRLEQILSSLYKLHGRPEAFRSVVYPETGHVYNDDQKQKMVEWFNRHLKGAQS
jgi:dienelactone hydrolase